MKQAIVGIIAGLIFFQSLAFAQLSTRDMDIDMQLNAEVGGVAPPTGSAAVAPQASVPEAFVFPPISPSAKVVFGQTDKRARVYDLKGKVTWTKNGTPLEKRLRVNDVLNQGDIIQTESKSSVSIAFDDSYMNAVHLPENTRAVIESIEPTNVRIENGAIYSAVNGLPQGGSWKVTTPAAVAAVRGTLYIVRYQAASGQFYAATVDIPDDGKISSIEIQEITGSQSADVPEGKEISLNQGQTPNQDLVGDLDPDSLQEILDFFEALVSERETQEEGYAPPTGNDSSDDSGINDDQNSDNNSQPNLDPSDTGVLNEDSQDAPPDSPLPGEDGPVIDDPKEDNKCEQDDRNHYDRDDRGGHDRDDRWNEDRERGDEHGRGDRNDRDRDDRWNDDRGRGGDDNDRGGRDDRGRDDDWNDDRGRGGDDNDRGGRDDRGRDDDWNDDRGRGGDDNDRGGQDDRGRDDDRGRGGDDNDRGGRDDRGGDDNRDRDDRGRNNND